MYSKVAYKFSFDFGGKIENSVDRGNWLAWEFSGSGANQIWLFSRGSVPQYIIVSTRRRSLGKSQI